MNATDGLSGSFAYRLLVLCATMLLPGATLWAQTPPAFERAVESPDAPPLWISAEAVAAAEKTKAGEKSVVASLPRAQCKRTSHLTDHRGDSPSESLADLQSGAKAILRGTIRTMQAGFSYGAPTSLLGVEISDALKGDAPRPLVYVDYLVAHFRIGSRSFCNANKGFEPRPGDEVLLFDFMGSVDRDLLLFAPRIDEIFFQREGETVFLPPRLKNTQELASVRTLDEVVDLFGFKPQPVFRKAAR